ICTERTPPLVLLTVFGSVVNWSSVVWAPVVGAILASAGFSDSTRYSVSMFLKKSAVGINGSSGKETIPMLSRLENSSKAPVGSTRLVGVFSTYTYGLRL